MHKMPYLRTMSCGLWIKQGSKHECDGNNGLSHLIEHLMINIANKSSPDFQKLINGVTSQGVSYNAGTGKETTSYYFTGLSNRLKDCLKTLSTIAIKNRFFDKELIENEKKIVTQEAVSFYSSFNQIKERTSQALWGNVGVGRVIVGSLKNIKNATYCDLEKIINEAYTPENATIVVIGGIDYDETLKIIEDCFSEWEDKDTRAYQEIVEGEPGIYFNGNNNGKNAVISIGFRTPSYINKDRIAIEVISKILGDTSLESRLVNEIRLNKGLAYTLGSFTSFYEKRGTLGFTAVCAKESVEEVVAIMMSEFRKVREKGFLDEEISRVKRILETRTILALDNITQQLKFIGKTASYGQMFSLEQEVRQINKIKKEHLNRVVNDIIIEENMGLASIGNYDIDKVLSILKIR